MAPIHYMDQYFLIINKVQWYSSEGKFTKDTSATNHQVQVKNYLL